MQDHTTQGRGRGLGRDYRPHCLTQDHTTQGRGRGLGRDYRPHCLTQDHTTQGRGRGLGHDYRPHCLTQDHTTQGRGRGLGRDYRPHCLTQDHTTQGRGRGLGHDYRPHCLTQDHTTQGRGRGLGHDYRPHCLTQDHTTQGRGLHEVLELHSPQNRATSPLTFARVPSTQYPATISPFLLSVHHASNSCRDNPPCIMPGLAMITHGPTSSNWSTLCTTTNKQINKHDHLYIITPATLRGRCARVCVCYLDQVAAKKFISMLSSMP